MLKTKSTFFKGEFLIVLTATLWSFSALLSKLASLNPILLVALRSFFALLVLLPAARFRFKFNGWIALGSLCYMANCFAYFLALDYTSAGNAVVLCYTAPILVLVWDCLYFKRKPTWTQIMVLAVTFGSILVIFAGKLTAGGLIGNALALFSGVAFSGLFFVNSLPRSSPIHSNIYASFVSLPLLLFFLPDIALMSGTSWFWVALMGTVQIGFSYVLFNAGMKHCSGFNASIISTLEVVLVPLLVAVFLREKIDIYTIVGGLAIMAAIIANVLLEKRRARKLAEKPAPQNT